MPWEETPTDNYALLKNQQQQLPWRVHQSKENCTGEKLSKAKHPRSSDTHMHCKECSAYLGKDMFLCNGFVKGEPLNCYRHYHLYHHNKEFASTMVIN